MTAKEEVLKQYPDAVCKRGLHPLFGTIGIPISYEQPCLYHPSSSCYDCKNSCGGDWKYLS